MNHRNAGELSQSADPLDQAEYYFRLELARYIDDLDQLMDAAAWAVRCARVAAEQHKERSYE